MLQQVICTIKVRRAPARHDNIDFKPLVERASAILPLSIVVADKGYDSENNHVLVRERHKAFSIIPPRYQEVPVWRTHAIYRKQLKRGYLKPTYNQRNKDETIFSVVKRLFGEHVTSRLVRTQNREIAFRCIAYNMHRMTNILVIVVASTEPPFSSSLYTKSGKLTRRLNTRFRNGRRNVSKSKESKWRCRSVSWDHGSYVCRHNFFMGDNRCQHSGNDTGSVAGGGVHGPDTCVKAQGPKDGG